MHVSANLPFSAQVSVPFPVSIGIDEVVRHPAWSAALASVRAGLKAGSLVILTGAPGLGKSLLLQSLKRELEHTGQAVVMLPGTETGAPAWPSSVVLVDEADRVPPELLHHLTRHASRCVLAGSPALPAMLGELGHRRTFVEMRPLLDDEAGPYLLAQVERAGLQDTLFGPGALDALIQSGGGNPRRLQQLANLALFRARMDELDEVGLTHVAEASGQQPVHDPAAASEPATPESPAASRPKVNARRASRISALKRPSFLVPAGLACCVAAATLLTLRPAGPSGAVDAGSAPVQVSQADTRPGPALSAPEPATPAGVASDTADATPPAAVPPVDTASNATKTAALAVPVRPPQAVPGPAALPRPPSLPVHVVVAFAHSDTAAEDRAIALVSALQQGGTDTVLSVGPRSARDPVVTYFYPGDQAVAANLARQMGETGRERLMVATGVPPRPGTIRLLISSARR